VEAVPVSGLDPRLLIAGDFIMLRMALVDALDGDIEAALVLQRIAWRCERDGFWKASHEDIQQETRLSERKVKGALKVLRDKGFLSARRATAYDATLVWSVLLDTDETSVSEGDETSVSPSSKTGDRGTATPPLAPEVTQFSLLTPPVPTVGKRKGSATPIPPEWLAMDTPPKELIVKAKEVGLPTADIGPVWRAFTSWHASKDTRYVRWEWTWRNWVEKEVARNKTKTKTTLDPKTGIAYGKPGRPDDAWMYRQDFNVNPLEGIN
jgi:hypothetical protein